MFPASRPWTRKGRPTLESLRPHSPEGRGAIRRSCTVSPATPVALDSNTFGYRWNYPLVATNDTKDGSLVRFPEYYHLVTNANQKAEWAVVCPEEVPAETGLAQARFDRPREDRPEPYMTPDHAAELLEKAQPRGRTFPGAPLGDGSVVTYYWYRFADQPAILNADLTDQEREALQARAEKINRT
jgi:hypothetical protein